MARSLASARFFSVVIANGISKAIARRGCATAAASQGEAVSKAAKGRGNMNDITAKRRPGEDSWVPDPKTGFYRPGNHTDDIDAAELRAMLLKKKHSGSTSR